DPKKCHWTATKRVLRYVRGTTDYGLEYKKNDQFFLKGYVDLDHARCIDDRKSTTGYIFHLGSELISWISKKQNIVSISSTE
ncbi:hypothetical protein KI387_000698, partial [Taxus chinensis]